MPASTSRAAASMLRLRSNCRVTLVLPSELDEVISVTPAMWPNWRSRGVATEEAMIRALAPGSPAETEMVGKSTWGSGDTGNTLKAMPPAMAIAMVSRVVATGLRMKGEEMLILLPFGCSAILSCRLRAFGMLVPRTGEALRQVVEEDVD